jgi:rod shape-determining protein MreC
VAASRRAGRSRLTLALLVLTSLAVLTLDFRDAGPIRTARDAAATVFSPLRGVADTVSSPFSNAWGGITDYGDVKKENEELAARVAALEGEAHQGSDAVSQLQAILGQLDISWVGDLETRTTRVIAGPVSNFSHTIEIDKGSSDGIREGMPVVTGAGLVGRVVQASSSAATVQLITDPDFRVGVRLVPEGTPGTARGSGPGHPLVVDTGIDAGRKDEVPKDTVLVTSGADRSAFPASIPVASVTSTRSGNGGLTLDLVAEPFADTEGLPFVTVLIWTPTE